MQHLVRTDRISLLRYAAVVAILLVVGGLFVQREFLSSASGPDADGLGLLEAHAPRIGQPAPDFALSSPDGKVVRLSDFRGKTVVLNFWATWCPPCRAEMPEFQQVWEERGSGGADDLVVLAVDLQEPERLVTAFVEEFDLTFPVVIDGTGAVTQHYGLRGLPGTFFIDRDGVLRKQSLGPVLGGLLEEGIAAADAP
jgi:peroxiredoxin